MFPENFVELIVKESAAKPAAVAVTKPAAVAVAAPAGEEIDDTKLFVLV